MQHAMPAQDILTIFVFALAPWPRLGHHCNVSVPNETPRRPKRRVGVSAESACPNAGRRHMIRIRQTHCGASAHERTA
eukprot:3760551-Pyramimonas_sp.AAC.1